MDKTLRTDFENITSEDGSRQNAAFMALLKATEKPVPWAYDVWDELVTNLSHSNNRVRAICSQLLCNLAKSDPDQRIMRDFDKLWAVTKDPRFVTARHCLQAIWKVGVAGEAQRERLVERLMDRFKTCTDEKNYTLVRFDILQSLRDVYDASPVEILRAQALDLIKMETDPKYQKKYAQVWKSK